MVSAASVAPSASSSRASRNDSSAVTAPRAVRPGSEKYTRAASASRPSSSTRRSVADDTGPGVGPTSRGVARRLQRTPTTAHSAPARKPPMCAPCATPPRRRSRSGSGSRLSSDEVDAEHDARRHLEHLHQERREQPEQAHLVAREPDEVEAEDARDRARRADERDRGARTRRACGRASRRHPCRDTSRDSARRPRRCSTLSP